jgi:hypothetical protein
VTLATVEIMEAIGYGPDSETLAQSPINLIAVDRHSDIFAQLQRNADGTAVYSCERWLRLRFTGGSIAASAVRFWIPNLSPRPGWALYYGKSETYRKPTNVRSDIAIFPVPTADPGYDAPNLFPFAVSTSVELDTTATFTQYSPWLVLQTQWQADNDDTFQDTEWEFDFAWDES